jgi:uncharacterized protein YehS (DUF1456 family)
MFINMCLIIDADPMTNNDILRRIRYTLDLNDASMIEIFGLGDCITKRSDVSDWMKKEDDPLYIELSDQVLAAFLNGLIVQRRGKREGVQMIAEKELSNNLILRKLKIAFDLKSDDIIELFNLVDKKISPHELSAFLRNPEQKQYRLCNDQYLRNFIHGLQVKFRNNSNEPEA